MSGFPDADDLDAEFERLQQELASVADDENTGEHQDNVVQSGTTEQEGISKQNIKQSQANGTVTIAAGAAQSRPSWELGLLERDLKDLQESVAIRKEAAEITGKTTSLGLENGKNSTPAVVAPPKGKWVWNGSRWEWKTSAAKAPVHMLAGAAPVGAVDPANEQMFPETLADPVGPVMHPRVMQNAMSHQKRSNKRMAAGEVWADDTLIDWPENDFRIFVGDLAPDATDKELAEAFCKYKSFNMARVVKDKKAGKCRGYGFVSFALGEDMVSALKEMNGKYVGSRPVKLKKSNWQKRNLTGKRRKDLKLFRSISKSSR